MERPAPPRRTDRLPAPRRAPCRAARRSRRVRRRCPPRRRAPPLCRHVGGERGGGGGAEPRRRGGAVHAAGHHRGPALAARPRCAGLPARAPRLPGVVGAPGVEPDQPHRRRRGPDRRRHARAAPRPAHAGGRHRRLRRLADRVPPPRPAPGATRARAARAAGSTPDRRHRARRPAGRVPPGPPRRDRAVDGGGRRRPGPDGRRAHRPVAGRAVGYRRRGRWPRRRGGGGGPARRHRRLARRRRHLGPGPARRGGGQRAEQPARLPRGVAPRDGHRPGPRPPVRGQCRSHGAGDRLAGRAAVAGSGAPPRAGGRRSASTPSWGSWPASRPCSPASPCSPRSDAAAHRRRTDAMYQP